MGVSAHQEAASPSLLSTPAVGISQVFNTELTGTRDKNNPVCAA